MPVLLLISSQVDMVDLVIIEGDKEAMDVLISMFVCGIGGYEVDE